ncbi:hypothetical protein O181_057657 [Austropuccinia psidii MF-1]|uniref:Reverse transcriptase domain-containing protein n=1 Tax=Austropuccinia psidii MF-1 TaxID=1389203 RepID=A0A9Q3ED62_9BASI|nr:hypothetical protein [Austropuccinia psidii MF-1]
MSYSEKEALKQLPEASSWPKFSGTGQYDHMELIDYIYELFIDVPSIPDYWITARLNTAFKGYAIIWYTEMKEIHGRGNWPWWKVVRNYPDHEFPNWEKQLLPTKAKNSQSASGKMTSIGKIIKEIIIPHRKGNIRLNSKFVVLEDAHIQSSNKEKKFSLEIYQISTHDPLVELLNGFRECQFSTYLPSKQTIGLLKMLRKNRTTFAIESLDARKEIEKHIHELLQIDFIRKIGHNEIVEIITPVLITWNDGKSRLCGAFEALNNYTKSYRYPIPRILHPLDKIAKAIYITKRDCMKCFHQNGVKQNSMKILGIICYMGIYEYTRMLFGIKNAPAHFQRMMDTIFQEEILEGFVAVYIDNIIIYSEIWEDHVQYIDRVLSKCTPTVVFHTIFFHQDQAHSNPKQQ